MWDTYDDFGNHAYFIASFFDLRLPLGDLIFIFFENKDDPDDCIQLDMYVGLDGYVRAYAKHSTTYGRYVDVQVVFCDEQGIYIDRIAGGHRRHRGFGGPFVAGAVSLKRGRRADSLRQ